MPKIQDSRRYQGDPLAISDALVNAGHAIGLHLKHHHSNFVEMKQGLSLFMLGWPATVTAVISPVKEEVLVEYLVRNGGLGPIQTAHLKRVLRRVITALAEREVPA